MLPLEPSSLTLLVFVEIPGGGNSVGLSVSVGIVASQVGSFSGLVCFVGDYIPLANQIQLLCGCNMVDVQFREE